MDLWIWRSCSFYEKHIGNLTGHQEVSFNVFSKSLTQSGALCPSKCGHHETGMSHSSKSNGNRDTGPAWLQRDPGQWSYHGKGPGQNQVSKDGNLHWIPDLIADLGITGRVGTCDNDSQ